MALKVKKDIPRGRMIWLKEKLGLKPIAFSSEFTDEAKKFRYLKIPRTKRLKVTVRMRRFLFFRFSASEIPLVR